MFLVFPDECSRTFVGLAGFVALGDMANALSSAGCAGGMDACLPQVAAQIKAAIDASRAASAAASSGGSGSSKRNKTHFAEALHVGFPSARLWETWQWRCFPCHPAEHGGTYKRTVKRSDGFGGENFEHAFWNCA